LIKGLQNQAPCSAAGRVFEDGWIFYQKNQIIPPLSSISPHSSFILFFHHHDRKSAAGQVFEDGWIF
jgi:hypothetical protein